MSGCTDPFKFLYYEGK